jgi:hypothetical protein
MIDVKSFVATIGSQRAALRNDSTLKNHSSYDCVFKTHSNSILTLAHGHNSNWM